MNFIRFLFIIEKITILIIVLTFIPIAIYVYRSQQIIIPSLLQQKYAIVNSQLQLNGFLVALKNITPCQPPPSPLFYQNCLSRCNLSNNCEIVSSNQSCLLPYHYVSKSYKICTQMPVVNQVEAGNNSFSLNTSKMPIAEVSTVNDTSVSLSYYCLLNVSACSSALNYFGKQLSTRYQQNYLEFWAAAKYLMYFGLVPLVGHILIVMLLDLLCKFNLRLTNSLLIVHEALIGIGLIVNGFLFNETNDELAEHYGSITEWCLVKDNGYCYQNLYKGFQDFIPQDNISGSFNTAMAFMLVLQILCLILIVVINILMTRYYKLREIDSSTSYQLHEL